METIENAVENVKLNPGPIVPPKNLFQKIPKGIILLFLIIIIIISLNFTVNLLEPWIIPQTNINPNPTPVTTVLKKLSSIATDSAFLQTELDLENLGSSQSSLDLSESKLSPPVLELNVNFEK